MGSVPVGVAVNTHGLRLAGKPSENLYAREADAGHHPRPLSARLSPEHGLGTRRRAWAVLVGYVPTRQCGRTADAQGGQAASPVGTVMTTA